MAELQLSIKFFWKEVSADLSKCFVCEDVIYYKMHQGFIKVGDKESPIKTLKVCDACKSEMENKNG